MDEQLSGRVLDYLTAVIVRAGGTIRLEGPVRLGLALRCTHDETGATILSTVNPSEDDKCL